MGKSRKREHSSSDKYKNKQHRGRKPRENGLRAYLFNESTMIVECKYGNIQFLLQALRNSLS
jgi:hypothetical protein